MKMMIKISLVIALAVVALQCPITARAGEKPLPESPKTFVHPGLYYSVSDLEFMRKKLQAKAEPWYSAWEQDKPTAAEDHWTPRPPVDWAVRKLNFWWNFDPIVAHKHALQWALTGNPANAAKAIEILNAWSYTLKTVVPGDHGLEKQGIGTNLPQFLNAAELLCHARPDGKTSGWAEADIRQFKKMLGIFNQALENYPSLFNGDWDAHMMNSVFCMAVFLDDHALFDRAVKRYLQGEKPNGGLTNFIYPSGQCQTIRSNQAHAQWALGCFVAICEVAWKQGLDLYGAENNRLLAGLEYSAKLNLGEDVPFEGEGGINNRMLGTFASIWEAPYQHYVYRKGLEMPYTKQIIFSKSIALLGRKQSPDWGGEPAGAYRPEGPLASGIGWGTFTMFKGWEDPQAVKNSSKK